MGRQEVRLRCWLFGVRGFTPAGEGPASREFYGFAPAREGAPPGVVTPGIDAIKTYSFTQGTTQTLDSYPPRARRGDEGDNDEGETQRHRIHSRWRVGVKSRRRRARRAE